MISALADGLRKSRAPLSAGLLVVVAVWIQFADHLTSGWPGEEFGNQMFDVLGSLQGIGTGTFILFVVGITGTVSIRVSGLLLEPPMRWFVERWQERSAVRAHYRMNRYLAARPEGNFVEVVVDAVDEQRKFLRNSWRWLFDWFPGRDAYIAYTRDNFWVRPKWDKEVIGWASNVIADIEDLPGSQGDLKKMLAQDSELQSLIIDLESEIERNPSAPFVENNSSAFVDRLDALRAESEYRAAVIPPLLLLLISVGFEWWAGIFAGLPVLILVYGASLAKQDDIALLSLGWLLEGNGTSVALEEIRRWSHEYSRNL